jgi:hypothetical protein
MPAPAYAGAGISLPTNPFISDPDHRTWKTGHTVGHLAGAKYQMIE